MCSQKSGTSVGSSTSNVLLVAAIAHLARPDVCRGGKDVQFLLGLIPSQMPYTPSHTKRHTCRHAGHASVHGVCTDAG